MFCLSKEPAQTSAAAIVRVRVAELYKKHRRCSKPLCSVDSRKEEWRLLKYSSQTYRESLLLVMRIDGERVDMNLCWY
jgi:hypothetical protein